LKTGCCTVRMKARPKTTRMYFIKPGAWAFEEICITQVPDPF
jgi:hypothetical protein